MLRAILNGKRRDFGLGPASLVTLAEARELAADYRKMISKGIDPKENARKRRDELNAIPTFKEAAERTHAEHKEGWRNDKHKAQWLSTLEAYVFPAIGHLPVDQVTAPAIRDLLAAIWLTKPETARRVRQRIGAVLNWSFAKGYRSAEAPMQAIDVGLTRQPKRNKHHEALPYAEAPALMRKLEAPGSMGRMALRFAILTAARSGEVRKATWGEMNVADKSWTVPGERMKAGVTHIVPLPDAAVEILLAIQPEGTRPDQFVFPGKGDKPLSDMTLMKALRTALPGTMTVHGFRSTFRDWIEEETDYPESVSEIALAHTPGDKVKAAYRRTKLIEKRRKAMNDWAEFLGCAQATTPALAAAA
jgi:integrase